jgi:hypothetical protein
MVEMSEVSKLIRTKWRVDKESESGMYHNGETTSFFLIDGVMIQVTINEAMDEEELESIFQE